jgi:HlyD family secretion protein
LTRNRILFIGIAAAAVIALAASYSAKSEIPIRAEMAERAPILSSISTNGKIEPANNFQSRTVGPSLVSSVLVKEGDRVKAGQLLVRLDEAEAQSQLAHARSQMKAAEADLAAMKKGGTQEEVLTNESNVAKAKTELDSAQRNYEALKKLQTTQAASVGEVEEAANRVTRAKAELNLLQQKTTQRYSSPEMARTQAQLEDARAAVAAAEDIVHHANVVAPSDGIVYSVPVKKGSFVNSGDLLVQVADLENMQVHAFVDEPEIGKLKIGQKVNLTWDAIPGRTWVGVVSHVPTTVVPRGTRSVGEVVCNVDNADLKLLPNVNVNVNVIIANKDNALTVSREAVVQDGDKRYVYVVDGGHVKKTEVETALSSPTRIEIIKGLQDKQQVALGSLSSQPLSDGAAVRVEQQ